MKTLVYFCHGAPQYFEEARFSILSSLYLQGGERPTYQIVVYTDDKSAFIDLDVTIVEVNDSTLTSWMGESDYIHRMKIMTVIDALERYPGAVAYIDVDSYFIRSPERLFDRIGPGRTCLHLLEGRLLETRTLINQSLSDLIRNNQFHDSGGNPLKISPDTRMWNSGVIGIHSDDIGFLREALNLSDQMWPHALPYESGRKPHTIEQLVVGYFFERSRLQSTHDLIYHYWPDYLRLPFAKRVGHLVASRDGVPVLELARAAYSRRPRADFPHKIRMQVRGTLRAVGVRISGIYCSA
ncbi:MAG: hypothetical protein ABSF50_21705 [Burkholderiaceae bacterium]|jgi:hypothetical protein